MNTFLSNVMSNIFYLYVFYLQSYVHQMLNFDHIGGISKRCRNDDWTSSTSSIAINIRLGIKANKSNNTELNACHYSLNTFLCSFFRQQFIEASNFEGRIIMQKYKNAALSKGTVFLSIKHTNQTIERVKTKIKAQQNKEANKKKLHKKRFSRHTSRKNSFSLSFFTISAVVMELQV